MANVKHSLLLASVLLLTSVAWSADFAGSGEEKDPGEQPITTTGKGEDPNLLPPPTNLPAESLKAAPKPLQPLEEIDPADDRIQATLPGPVGNVPTPANPLPTLPLSPMDNEKAPATASEPEELDLTADLKSAPRQGKRGPFWVELQDYQYKGLVTDSTKKVYELLAVMKKDVYQMADDLNAGGKEKTRLIYTSEQVGKAISDLLAIWPNDEDFRDLCRFAKSRALVLEEKLREEPRKWTHVRWAFQSLQKEVKRIREAAAARAETQPQPIKIVTKDGKEVIVEPGRDIQEIKRERKEEALEDLKRQRDQLRKESEELDKDRRPLGTGD